MYLLWILLVATCSEGGVTGEVAGRAACESTGLGEPARITCHYSQNVVEASDVSVVSLRQLHRKQEMVAECYRFLEKEFDCLHIDGYEINGTISDQLIINIPRAGPEHQGTYSCDVVRNQNRDQIAICVLEYEESNNAATPAPPFEQETDDHRKEDADTSDAKVWMEVTIVLSVLMGITALTILLVCFRWRLRKSRLLRYNSTTDSNKQANTGDGKDDNMVFGNELSCRTSTESSELQEDSLTTSTDISELEKE